MKRLIAGAVIVLSALSLTACDVESADEERLRLSKECLDIGGNPKLNGEDDAWAKAQFICERRAEK